MNNITPESINLKLLPSILLIDRKQLPSVASIYFAINSQNVVHYIGRTTNLRKRWQRHHQRSALDALGDIKIAWIKIEEIALLVEIERSMIEFFRPLLNGSTSHPKLKILKFNFQQIKTQVKDGQIWFCATDITKAIGYKNTAETIADNVSIEYTTKISLGLKGRVPLFISEPGLYQLIVRSNLSGAEVFKNWLVEQVLPSIGKTKQYTKGMLFTKKGELLENLPTSITQEVFHEQVLPSKPLSELGALMANLPALIARENFAPTPRVFKVRDIVMVNYGTDDRRKAMILDFLGCYLYVKFLNTDETAFVIASKVLKAEAN